MNVRGNDCVGGLLGQLGYDSNWTYGRVNYSYAVGKVKGVYGVGGLVGYNADANSKTSYSYYDTETTGQESSDGGTGYTTEKMKSSSTYSGWDANIWNIVDGQYPTLK